MIYKFHSTSIEVGKLDSSNIPLRHYVQKDKMEFADNMVLLFGSLENYENTQTDILKQLNMSRYMQKEFHPLLSSYITPDNLVVTLRIYPNLSFPESIYIIGNTIHAIQEISK